MRRNAVNTPLLVALVCLVCTIVEAQVSPYVADFGAVRIRAGLFEPQGDSAYWANTMDRYIGKPDDFQDATFAMDYLWRYRPSAGLLFSFGFFSGEELQSYLDYVDDQGFEIDHTTTLDIADFTVAWLYQFGRRDAAVQPYLGAGAGVVFWDLQEVGWFIDFADPSQPVVSADYRTDGTTLEYFALAGIEVPISRAFSLLAEARWRRAEDDLSGEFAMDHEIDLSGTELTIGMSWNF